MHLPSLAYILKDLNYKRNMTPLSSVLFIISIILVSTLLCSSEETVDNSFQLEVFSSCQKAKIGDHLLIEYDFSFFNGTQFGPSAKKPNQLLSIVLEENVIF